MKNVTEAQEEEIRDIAKGLIWNLTSNFKSQVTYDCMENQNPHFIKGFVSLIEYRSAIVCDDWPAESMKTFSKELENFDFIRYICDDHSKSIFKKFATVCSNASGIDNVNELMNSGQEVPSWPTLQDYRTLGQSRDFLRYPGGIFERYFAKGRLYLKE